MSASRPVRTLSAIWILFVQAIGRRLRQSMRLLTGRTVHPKHTALPEEHQHWYKKHPRCDWRVLDLGCGEGGHVRAIASNVASVVGIDTDKKALIRAVPGKNILYREHDLETVLPLDDSSFDAVLALDVIEHLQRREAFMREIHRVLRPQGNLFLSAPNAETPKKKILADAGFFHYSDPDHKTEFTQAQITKLVESSGFEVLSVEPTVKDTPFEGWIDFLFAISPALYRKAWMKKRNAALADPSCSTGFRIHAMKKGEETAVD